MFQIKTNHVCTIGDESSRSFLPALSPTASYFQKFKRVLKKLILITELNPKSLEFFKSTSEIIDERKNQVESDTWIVHPFSTFRLYYEMWMAFVFLTCMIFLPLDAAYKMITKSVKPVETALNVACYIDIIMNFRTGYKSVSQEKIVMDFEKIARHYVFGIYFIVDVVSSLPETYGSVSKIIEETIDFLSLLKIIRLFTLIDYMNGTLIFYRVRSWLQTTVHIFLTLLITVHYLACLFPVLGMAHQFATHNYSLDQSVQLHLHINTTGKGNDFASVYSRNIYTAFSYIFATDIGFKHHMPWSLYLTAILGYIIGKFLLCIVTVSIINLLQSHNMLEIKYFAMMSQVDAYMTAKQFPALMQSRMREYYLYKYRQKYFKEHGVKNFISEKLKKEINYHTCRRLVNTVQIFQQLPQEVVENIISSLRSEIYLTNDIIIKANSEGDCMYFLASGTVIVLSPSGEKICKLEDGDYFGEISLLIANQKRSANIIAMEICEVYKLDRKSFKKCMESNKGLFKHMQAEAKKRLASTRDIESQYMRARSSFFIN